MKFSGLHFRIGFKCLKKADLTIKILSCLYTSFYQDTENSFCDSVWKIAEYKDLSAWAYSQDWSLQVYSEPF